MLLAFAAFFFLHTLRFLESPTNQLAREFSDARTIDIEGIVWECSPETFHFTFVSRQCERILGYTPEQWIADPRFWHDHLHPEDADKAITSCHDFCAAAGRHIRAYANV